MRKLRIGHENGTGAALPLGRPCPGICSRRPATKFLATALGVFCLLTAPVQAEVYERAAHTSIFEMNAGGGRASGSAGSIVSSIGNPCLTRGTETGTIVRQDGFLNLLKQPRLAAAQLWNWWQ